VHELAREPLDRRRDDRLRARGRLLVRVVLDALDVDRRRRVRLPADLVLELLARLLLGEPAIASGVLARRSACAASAFSIGPRPPADPSRRFASSSFLS
jgi:hypothetical protein